MSTPEQMNGDSLQAIEMGGERFVLSTPKSIKMAYKGAVDFHNAFKGISTQTQLSMDRIKSLLLTYLPSERPKGPITFPAGDTTDKVDLLKILNARVEQLQRTTENPQSPIITNNYRRISDQLQQLIDEITGESKVGPARKKRKPLTENEIFSLILEFSWYLSHPNLEMNDEWEGMIKKMDTSSLNGLMTNIQEEEKKQGKENMEKKTAMNYFQNIDVKDVLHQSSKNQAMSRIKNMVLFPGSESGKDMKRRIRELMSILVMKKFVEDPLVYREGLPVITDATMKQAQDQMIPQLVKAEEPVKAAPSPLSAPLGKAMMPVFDYFKEAYDPIYPFIEELMEAFSKKQADVYKSDALFMNELLHMLHMLTHLQKGADGKLKHGVYRINHITGAMSGFISFALKYTKDTKMGEKVSEEDRTQFKENLFKLPVFRLSTFRRSFGSSTGTQPTDGIPYIQFAMVKHNVFPRPDTELSKLSVEEYAKQGKYRDFFKERAVYFIISDTNVSENSRTPMNRFTVDYTELVGPAGYTVKSEEELPAAGNPSVVPPNLEEVMKVSDHGFVHGELALCAYYQLKKTMPQ